MVLVGRRKGEDLVPRRRDPDRVLELILFQAVPRGDVKPVAKALLDRFGSFGAIAGAEPAELKKVRGIGDSAVVALKAVRAAALKMTLEEVIERPVIGSWKKLLAYCRASMAHEKTEQFRVMFLDRRNALGWGLLNKANEYSARCG